MIRIRNLLPAVCVAACACIGGCAKHDPVLPGVRAPVFADDEAAVLDVEVPVSVLEAAWARKTAPAPAGPGASYEQTPENEIYEIAADGARRKIFGGFPAAAHVDCARAPVSAGGFVYAGLSTGEVVKVAPRARAAKWTADVFKPSAMTGGAGILDIVAPVVVDGANVYAAGLGGAFCKLRNSDGAKVWCAWVSSALPFSVYGGLALLASADGRIYAFNTGDGSVYWRRDAACAARPELARDGDDFIVKCAGEDGEEIKIAAGGKS
jgi:outer membrane protein assembly factor BamB